MEPKHILIVVTGGIAAYKACDLTSRLSKTGHEIRVVMTEHATKFVTPLTFESLCHRPVLTSLFEDHPEDPIAHVNLAKWADVVCVVPATANIIGKIAHGIADDLASTVCLAAFRKRILCPAMNVHMYENEAVQDNLRVLRNRGWEILEPVSGLLACQDEGKGKLPPVESIAETVLSSLHDKPLAGKRVVVTAGPTQEALDPVRFISNHSTGKQGYAIARAARNLGAETVLITGPVSLAAPSGMEVVPVVSAREMFEAVKARQDADMFVLAAAVSDFRPKDVSDQKIKKRDASLVTELEPNPDILAWLGEHKRPGQKLVGFAMETQNLEENARHKLEAKHCDLLVANDLFVPGAGFGTDTNVVLFITPEKTRRLEKTTKEDLGYRILEEAAGC
ncbi:bifunctional phosphopantothenoylcysteine decarboxylase/phosphopantothenate--cysteine ligase CoaBC [Faecalibaculum rodentium]|jgi:phosphopantothenoylcysteine decarboxylase/phosphopantothenate--cysteine ligase|uniref:Coenzyme A biosynthesis bifunctional protein CoaBC n=1 Tax=Faecalibaculum rodentium TaxID=1702221 RepID=A0A1Q9YI72_9FIRM|nr:bifunctional phosphopantothenoylcysteine decarboxylase/phosphopantothenate--cysteine ligase CoaBC [Faecalibaculum rodentium]OLU43938.1 phosphopantothenoylcysteine decarboxylase [Faecalibaculum rodentium]